MFNNTLLHFSRHCDLAYWNSKLQLRVKNTRYNITVKNRVHVGHMLSLDDEYCTAGFLPEGKIFMNQLPFVKILPWLKMFTKTLITITALDDTLKIYLLKS